MTKADVLAKLEEYKDRPIEIGLADEGALLYSGIANHWLFVKDDTLVEIKANSSDGTYGFATNTQQQSPFVITTVAFDTVNYIRSYIKNVPGDITTKIAGLTPVGTTKTLEDITVEIESNSVRKVNSPRGYVNSDAVAPGGYGGYGEFKGSAVSTEIDGVPAYIKKALQ